MKMTRKFIPALVMLIVSAIMLSTASFAWFATSTTVNANNMTVTANANTKFLQISNAIGGTYDTKANASTASANVDLVHANFEGTTISWYTGTSNKTNDKGSTNAEALVFGDEEGDPKIEDYALVNKFWFKMSSTSNANATNLRVSAVEVTNGSSSIGNALRVLVKGPDGVQLWSNATGTFAKDASSANYLITGEHTIGTTANDTNSVEVYVYYDGEDNSATSDNAGSLTDMTVSVTFDAD